MRVDQSVMDFLSILAAEKLQTLIHPTIMHWMTLLAFPISIGWMCESSLDSIVYLANLKVSKTERKRKKILNCQVIFEVISSLWVILFLISLISGWQKVLFQTTFISLWTTVSFEHNMFSTEFCFCFCFCILEQP